MCACYTCISCGTALRKVLLALIRFSRNYDGIGCQVTFSMNFLISTTFPNHTRLRDALSSIKGLGKSTSLQVCEELGISPCLPLRLCTSRHLDNVTALVVERFRINDDLQEQKRQARARIRAISAYRSFRYAQGLPCRGQRTRSNATTCRRLSINDRRIVRQGSVRRSQTRSRARP